jgi:hypothetical protein
MFCITFQAPDDKGGGIGVHDTLQGNLLPLRAAQDTETG